MPRHPKPIICPCPRRPAMPNPSATVSAGSFVCSRCCKLLPESEFRRRSKSSTLRMRQCSACHATYERQRRRDQRQRAAGLTLQRSASAIARAPNLQRLSTLLDLLVTQFGGHLRLYQFWLAEIERLKTKRRPAFRLLRFCEMLANAESLRDARAAECRQRFGSPEWRTALQNEL